MNFSIISIFPEMFDSLVNFGITRKAFENNICKLSRYNLRDFTVDNYHRVDDKSYGGGPKAVMKIEPLELALNEARTCLENDKVAKPLVVYLSPQGISINQNLINTLATEKGIIFVCGRYEGVDERFIERNVDLELSTGDFVVSGGEFPAMLVMDAIIRQLPDVLNNYESVINDSFINGLLDYPHYTVPRDYHGDQVPDVLLNGNHKQITLWRLKMSLWRTYLRRKDLLTAKTLTKIESGLLEEMIKYHNK